MAPQGSGRIALLDVAGGVAAGAGRARAGVDEARRRTVVFGACPKAASRRWKVSGNGMARPVRGPNTGPAPCWTTGRCPGMACRRLRRRSRPHRDRRRRVVRQRGCLLPPNLGVERRHRDVHRSHHRCRVAARARGVPDGLRRAAGQDGRVRRRDWVRGVPGPVGVGRRDRHVGRPDAEQISVGVAALRQHQLPGRLRQGPREARLFRGLLWL